MKSTILTFICFFVLLASIVYAGESLESQPSNTLPAKKPFLTNEWLRKTMAETIEELKADNSNTQVIDDKCSVRDLYKVHYYNTKAEFNAIKLDNEKWIRKHQRKIFSWQYYSSIIIFVIVVLLVFIGVALSYYQFRSTFQQIKSLSNSKIQPPLETEQEKPIAPEQGKDLDKKPDASKTVKTDAVKPVILENQLASATRTKVSFGKDGISIDSSVLGLIILFFSFLFFYMYITVVHPINAIDINNPTSTPNNIESAETVEKKNK